MSVVGVSLNAGCYFERCDNPGLWNLQLQDINHCGILGAKNERIDTQATDIYI